MHRPSSCIRFAQVICGDALVRDTYYHHTVSLVVLRKFIFISVLCSSCLWSNAPPPDYQIMETVHTDSGRPESYLLVEGERKGHYMRARLPNSVVR